MFYRHRQQAAWSVCFQKSSHAQNLTGADIVLLLSGRSPGASKLGNEERHAPCKSSITTEQKQPLPISCLVLFSNLFRIVSVGKGLPICETNTLTYICLLRAWWSAKSLQRLVAQRHSHLDLTPIEGIFYKCCNGSGVHYKDTETCHNNLTLQ